MLVKGLFYVYVRMLVVMAISLLASGLIFRNLGVDDYGIYAVVGGVVIIMAFLNNAMIATTQRYLSLSVGDWEKTAEVLASSKSIHLIIAIFLLACGETFGLYLVNAHLNFDDTRAFAVNVVYQFSLASMLATIVSAPYMAMVISHQRLGLYTALGIADAVLKLILAVVLGYLESDRLIFYAGVLSCISLLTLAAYYTYTRNAFPEINGAEYNLSLGKLRDMGAFAGWNLLGVLAGLGQNVGVNVLMNFFFRPEINASRALSLQVYNAISTVSANAQAVYAPAIVRRLSLERASAANIAILFCKLSFLATLMVLIPAHYYLQDLLVIWLGEPPAYIAVFINVMFVELLVASLSGPLHSLIQGDGNIWRYQAITSGLLLLNLPIGWALYICGHSPEAIYYVSCALTAVALLARLALLDGRSLISFAHSTTRLILPVMAVIAVVALLGWHLDKSIASVMALELVVFAFALRPIIEFISISRNREAS